MKISTKIKLVVPIGVLILLISSCFKSEEYPLEPVISDPQVSVIGDSATVSFGFTDGDADIGLAESDTFGVHAPGEFYYYNIYIDYFEKDDNLGWIPGTDLNNDTITFAYRIKPIEVSNNTEGIKGTIDVLMESFKNPFSSQSDTIRYEIRLIDRALNVSNTIQTNEVISQ